MICLVLEFSSSSRFHLPLTTVDFPVGDRVSMGVEESPPMCRLPPEAYCLLLLLDPFRLDSKYWRNSIRRAGRHAAMRAMPLSS